MSVVLTALRRPYTFVVLAILIAIFGVLAALNTPTSRACSLAPEPGRAADQVLIFDQAKAPYEGVDPTNDLVPLASLRTIFADPPSDKVVTL